MDVATGVRVRVRYALSHDASHKPVWNRVVQTSTLEALRDSLQAGCVDKVFVWTGNPELAWTDSSGGEWYELDGDSLHMVVPGCQLMVIGGRNRTSGPACITAGASGQVEGGQALSQQGLARHSAPRSGVCGFLGHMVTQCTQIQSSWQTLVDSLLRNAEQAQGPSNTRDSQHQAATSNKKETLCLQAQQLKSRPCKASSLNSKPAPALPAVTMPLTWLRINFIACQMARAWQAKAERTTTMFPGSDNRSVWYWWQHAQTVQPRNPGALQQARMQDILQAMFSCQPAGLVMNINRSRGSSILGDSQPSSDFCGVCDVQSKHSPEHQHATHPNLRNVGLLLNIKPQNRCCCYCDTCTCGGAEVVQMLRYGESILSHPDSLRGTILTAVTDSQTIQLYEIERAPGSGPAGYTYYKSEERVDVLECLCAIMLRDPSQLGLVDDLFTEYEGDKLQLMKWLGSGSTSNVFRAVAEGDKASYALKVWKASTGSLEHKYKVLQSLVPAITAGAALPKALQLCQEGMALLMTPECTPLNIDLSSSLSVRQLHWRLPGIVYSLELAHKLGYLHNDLKPANLMVGPATKVAPQQLPGSYKADVVRSAYDDAAAVWRDPASTAEEGTWRAVYIIDWGCASPPGSKFLQHGGTVRYASQRLLTLLGKGTAAEDCVVNAADDLESLVKSMIHIHHPEFDSVLNKVQGFELGPVDCDRLYWAWSRWEIVYPKLLAAARSGAYGTVAGQLQQLIYRRWPQPRQST